MSAFGGGGRARTKDADVADDIGADPDGERYGGTAAAAAARRGRHEDEAGAGNDAGTEDRNYSHSSSSRTSVPINSQW